MAHVQSVLIVGGGIGGLTLAAALGQRGIRCDVVELKAVESVYGVGIIQPGNALRALRSLGLMEACLQAGFQVSEYRYYDADENLLAALHPLRVAGPDAPAMNMLPRPALHQILRSAAEKVGATIRLGVTVESLRNQRRALMSSFRMASPHLTTLWSELTGSARGCGS